MADRKPLKVLPDGGGDSTGLGEFVAADTVGVVDGGTGLATVGSNQLLTGNGTSALTSESNLTFDGTTLNVVGNAGVGIARTDGTLHVHTASAGSVTASVHYDDLVVEGSGNTGISILAPEDSASGIAFGSDADNDVGYIYAQQSGTAGSRFMAFAVNAAERMRILSGGGITFNGDTAAANALDDYEEGTWTPVWKFGGTSGTVNTQTDNVAYYTKIGNMVTVWYRGALANAPSGSGSMVITGLPFTIQNTTNQYLGTGAWTNKIAYGDGIAVGGNPNETAIHAEKLTSSTSTGVTSVQNSDCAQYSQIRFQFQYTV
jgi:hypothetical protein